MDSQTNDIAAAPDTQPRKRRGSKWVLWACVLVFLVYPLSSGPLARLWLAVGLPQEPLLGLYTPLILLAFYMPGFRSLFVWYLDIWKAEMLS